MSQVMFQYYEACLNRNRGVINLATDPFKLALLANTYTPDFDLHTVWADVSAHEIADGDGYTAGGASLAGQTLTRSDWKTTFDANDIIFTNLTKTFRYGVLYVNDTKVFGGSIVKPLYAYILFDDTPADIVLNGVDYRVQWSSLGISIFGPVSEF